MSTTLPTARQPVAADQLMTKPWYDYFESLKAQIAALQAQVTSLQAQITTLQNAA